ncbi:hypothetical protein SELMODRAFT_132063 [Selaginella moellendorffii]|uniref:Uncharacterized protein CYP797B19 n=1 Tax=Selaginella moellendorffii TaxID=88036 RepID=D8T536_SELML|nr:hypothetical protein SELMODRAFT_132063 [Selaginella moellendorffii]
MALESFRGDAQAELYTKASLLVRTPFFLDNRPYAINFQETLLGGTETTGVTCEWIMAAVMHNPQVLTNLQEELQRVVGSTRMARESDISKLEYLQAVIKETFRRYPPATLLMPRTAHKATTIGGYHIPKGTTLLVNSWAIGMDPAVWEDPTQFLPDRFLGIPIDIKGHDFELIPFGSGRRKCPGMALGLRAVELLVANLIHGFHWSFVPGMTLSMEDECHSVSQLKIPLQAIAVPRLPKEVYANI